MIKNYYSNYVIQIKQALVNINTKLSEVSKFQTQNQAPQPILLIFPLINPTVTVTIKSTFRGPEHQIKEQLVASI